MIIKSILSIETFKLLYDNFQIILLYEVLALAIPNSIIWLTSFILLFHSWLNFLAEFLMFADREVSDYQTLVDNNLCWCIRLYLICVYGTVCTLGIFIIRAVCIRICENNVYFLVWNLLKWNPHDVMMTSLTCKAPWTRLNLYVRLQNNIKYDFNTPWIPIWFPLD